MSVSGGPCGGAPAQRGERGVIASGKLDGTGSAKIITDIKVGVSGHGVATDGTQSPQQVSSVSGAGSPGISILIVRALPVLHSIRSMLSPFETCKCACAPLAK